MATRPGDAADFDEFQPEGLGLGEYAVQRSLVGQDARQHGIVAVRPGPEAGERGTRNAERIVSPKRPRIRISYHRA